MVCDTTPRYTENLAPVSLNPYSIGIWSATAKRYVEYVIKTYVLILILLEYGLRRNTNKEKGAKTLSLNPYSIGIWSATAAKGGETRP